MNLNNLLADLEMHRTGYEIPVPVDAISVEVIHSNTEPTLFSGPEMPCSISSHNYTDGWALRMVSGSQNAVMPGQWPQ